MAGAGRAAFSLDHLSAADCRTVRAPGLVFRTESRQARLPLRHVMHWSFYLVAGLTVGSGIAAMSLRNIVHCALVLTVTFGGLALLYLQLNAQFVALAQVLVYIGAVAILIVFAILLTRSSDIGPQSRRSLLAVASGVLVALAAFATISKA